jgi:hypothetical protein
MTAAQLSQQIARIQQKRASLAQEQAAYHQLREEQVDAALSANKAAQQAYVRDQNRASANYYSPYVNQPPKEPPFANVRTGPDIGFSVGGFGGFRMYYNTGQF